MVGLKGDRSVRQLKPPSPGKPPRPIMEESQRGDYTLETLPESPIGMSYGGTIKLVEIKIPTSTTEIINRILAEGQIIKIVGFLKYLI